MNHRHRWLCFDCFIFPSMTWPVIDDVRSVSSKPVPIQSSFSIDSTGKRMIWSWFIIIEVKPSWYLTLINIPRGDRVRINNPMTIFFLLFDCSFNRAPHPSSLVSRWRRNPKPSLGLPPSPPPPLPPPSAATAGGWCFTSLFVVPLPYGITFRPLDESTLKLERQLPYSFDECQRINPFFHRLPSIASVFVHQSK